MNDHAVDQLTRRMELVVHFGLPQETVLTTSMEPSLKTSKEVKCSWTSGTAPGFVAAAAPLMGQPVFAPPVFFDLNPDWDPLDEELASITEGLVENGFDLLLEPGMGSVDVPVVPPKTLEYRVIKGSQAVREHWHFALDIFTA